MTEEHINLTNRCAFMQLRYLLPIKYHESPIQNDEFEYNRILFEKTIDKLKPYSSCKIVRDEINNCIENIINKLSIEQ